MTYSPEHPWQPTTEEDYALRSQRAKNWREIAFDRKEYHYPFWEDPRVSMDLDTYQAWRKQQKLPPWKPRGKVREVDTAQPVVKQTKKKKNAPAEGATSLQESDDERD